MKRNNTIKITFMALSISINIIGGFITFTFRLPIFIDTIGTILTSFLFGPLSGAMVGFSTSIVNGVTFDSYSLYFFPVQIILGWFCGTAYKKGLFKGKLMILGTLISSMISALTSSIIAAYVFSGITSSGTTFIVMYLKNIGLNIVTSVFSTQIIFDLLDKFVIITIVLKIINLIKRNNLLNRR